MTEGWNKVVVAAKKECVAVAGAVAVAVAVARMVVRTKQGQDSVEKSPSCGYVAGCTRLSIGIRDGCCQIRYRWSKAGWLVAPLSSSHFAELTGP